MLKIIIIYNMNNIEFVFIDNRIFFGRVLILVDMRIKLILLVNVFFIMIKFKIFL